MPPKVIAAGDRAELHIVEKKAGTDEKEVKVYYSTVCDVLSEGEIEITMPMEKGRLILLPEGLEFIIVFYEENGMYECMARVKKRYKTGNIYVLVLELISSLQRHQRREFYRFDCMLEMSARQLLPEEIRAMETDLFFEPRGDLPVDKAMIADISGGGMRFFSNQIYEPGTLLHCTFSLEHDGKKMEIEVINKVLRFQKQETGERKGAYEYRSQFQNLSERVRENIIKWIFEEERRIRQKERFS